MKNKNYALAKIQIGQLVDAAPKNASDFDTDSYIPSIQFQGRLHERLGNAMSNMNSLASLYNRWQLGEMKCNWSVVSELTMVSRLVSRELKTISEMCQQDRKGMIYNPMPNSCGCNLTSGLTSLEADELNTLLNELTPSELLQLLRHRKGVWS
ncbi:TPA: hypothetical protein ACVOYT_004429 [Vibrio diabolicus]